jgi:phage FluMu gp28-like protein
MSAYILTDLELSTLAAFIAPVGKVQMFADKLKRINIQSVNFRYNEKTPITDCVVSFPDDLNIEAVSSNWNYQSCEDDSSVDYHVMSLYIQALLKAVSLRSAS